MSGEHSLPEVADLLQTSAPVVWVTGAGLSVASGISPYRKSKDAVWENFITDWGTAARFNADPQAWYQRFWFAAHPSLKSGGDARPNPGHRAMTSLARARPNHHIITQNIDGLHAESGAPLPRLIEIHGRADTFVCSNDRCSMRQTPLTGISLAGVDDGDLPECDVCGATLRPLVLLFDEYYESQPFFRAREARTWLNDAGVVVFVGTSFSVGITSMAVHAAQASGAEIVNINLEPLSLEHGRPVRNVLMPAEQALPALLEAVGPST